VSDDFSQVPFGGQPFVDNPEPRCPCLLLVDVSQSMKGRPIQQVNEGLRAFRDSLAEDSLASKRVEVSLLTFGPVRVRQHFETADEFIPPALSTEEDTPLGQAILDGLDLLDARKELYRQNGVAYYRPWVFLLTDGSPTDGEVWKQAARRVREGESSKSFSFFAVGVQGANMDILDAISERGAMPLDGLRFRELFSWLSSSLKSVSHSRVGDKVSLAKPDWTSV
jgi:uncharacterized protein YegL